MSYNSNLPADTTAPAEIRENFRALKDDKIVAAATAITADTAVKLANARKISLDGDAKGSTSFDGSADVTITVDVLTADTSAQCTGNAATATKLETARNINGVAFDGSADITITAAANGGNADTVDGKHASDFATVEYGVPVGTVAYLARQTAPTGWLKANGSAVSRTQYANLFAAVGTMFGAGDGSTTFNLPDLRGEFIRGFDDGRGVDAGRQVGTWQKGSVSAIDTSKTATVVAGINYNIDDSATSARRSAGLDEFTSGLYEGIQIPWVTNPVGIYGEVFMGMARPRNIALLACIKY